MSKLTLFSLNLIGIVFMFLLASCEKKEETTLTPAPSTSIASIRKTHPGDLLVLLLGREGCPGTAKATSVLEDYMKVKPTGVSVLRVDVPLPGNNVVLPEAWTHSFEIIADKNRAIAGQLEFFYYPTLYIFDKDGVLRFQGGCDLSEFPEIAKKIKAEKPGDNKIVYTKIMPENGMPSPSFSGKTLDGKNVTLRSLCGKNGLLLFFGRKSCPFSMKGLDELTKILPEIRNSGVNAAVIVNDEGGDAFRAFKKYSRLLPVIPDRGNVIFNKYVVSVTPYFYFIDECGTIFAHRSFTKGAALNTVAGYLDNTRIRDSFNVQGAG